MALNIQRKMPKKKRNDWLFLAELKNIRLRYFGFTFFWAWMSLFMYSKAIFHEAEALSLPSPHIPLMVLTLSSFLTLAYVMFFMPRRLAPLSLHRIFVTIAPVLTILGTVLRALGGSWVMFNPGIGAITGSFVAGCGMILTMLMWAEFYGSIGALRAAIYMPLSLILAIPLFHLVTWAPSGVGVVLMCLLPILAVVFISLNKQEVKAKDALSCYASSNLGHVSGNPSRNSRENTSETPHKSLREAPCGNPLKSQLLLPWKICLAASLYGVISGLVNSASSIDEGVIGLTQIVTVVLSLLLVVGVLIFGKEPQHSGFTYKPTLLVMAAGCLSLLFLTNIQVAAAIVSNGYMLFYTLSWIMYSDVSFRLNLPSYKVFASGRIFGALGYAFGMALGYLFSQTFHLDIQRPEVLSALTVCLLLFTTIFVLDEKDVMNTWGRQPREISSIANFASSRDLTPREVEVLELLSKGRSLPYIQQQLHISHSTANSHAANIYQKLNVHSKQELISLIEQESPSQFNGGSAI
jgi:DNA-binding CsgD family transcriptional regulator/MFS family permease